MPATRQSKPSRSRRIGQSAFGALLLMRLVLLLAVVALLVAAGGWSSWGDVRNALEPDGRERGTLSLQECDREECTGSFTPDSDGGETQESATLEQPIGREAGDTLSVALRPGTTEAVRTGLGGALYGALPLAGALILAGIVIAGGLRWFRTAWITAGVGIVMMASTILLW
ncbi:hypothetical protein PJ985_06615 [Streptomyces sp. ACA25]|uniref:hypothetical protein n=1 Tax=Streptomyces sp. ACA25 TaxID=3022596 RepID=UPI002307A218|nr:hypothetical protein [Streptomyces sp. ACA25]MDB1087238.1 hypothetical protein [Streptomyces sp. ACA25]